MIDVSQVIIISVLTTLTIIVSMVGIQAYYFLKESRVSIKKLNEVLDDTHVVSSKLAHSTETVSGALAGLKTVLSVVNTFKKDTKGGE